MTNPANARRILQRYPNVMMNIKVTNPKEWKNLEPVVDSHGQVHEDWAQLYQEMPSRFMIGTDAKFMRGEFIPAGFDKKVDQMRNLLGSLSPEAAGLIAYDNARDILP